MDGLVHISFGQHSVYRKGVEQVFNGVPAARFCLGLSFRNVIKLSPYTADVNSSFFNSLLWGGI